MSRFRRHYVCLNCSGVKTPVQMQTPSICKGCHNRFAYISIGKSNMHISKSVICNHHWPFDCRC
jgi:hypothetical protein